MAVKRVSAKLLTLSVGLISGLAGSSAAWGFQPPDARAAGMDMLRLAQIPVRLREFVAAHQTSGTVTLVARHGRVASFEAVGYQDLESHRPMQRDTLFRIASLTKPITCAGIMVLVDAGKLSVIDPVEDYLPEYKGLKVDSAVARPMNIEDLMVHTSGLASDVAEPAHSQTLAELAVLGARMPLLSPPGTEWHYSNIGYDVLGRIIEIVSHQPYDQFLQSALFDPLGMKDTCFFPSPDKLSRLATLYTLKGAGLQPAAAQFSAAAPQIPMPGGGLISSAEDLFRFNQMMRNQGSFAGKRVLSAAAVALMTTSHTGEKKAGWSPGVGHGYGYEVVRNADGMFRYNSIGSFVKGGAFRTYEFVDPEKDLVGVFLMQLTNGGGDTNQEINRFVAISGAAVE